MRDVSCIRPYTRSHGHNNTFPAYHRGLIVSYWGEEAVGARRKYYTITDAGRKQYKENISDWERTRAVVDNLLYAPRNEGKENGTE